MTSIKKEMMKLTSDHHSDNGKDFFRIRNSCYVSETNTREYSEREVQRCNISVH